MPGINNRVFLPIFGTLWPVSTVNLFNGHYGFSGNMHSCVIHLQHIHHKKNKQKNGETHSASKFFFLSLCDDCELTYLFIYSILRHHAGMLQFMISGED